jgi:hypothetical protein
MNLTIDETNLRTIEASFLRIANEILNEHIILVDFKKYRVVSIEFYFYNNTNHKDENSHALKYHRAKERQLLHAKWYLHKISINPKYKHKGLDFTFGNGESFGGILIKEIMDIDNDIKFTQSKLVDEFIRVLKPSSKEEFLEMIEINEKIKFEKINIERKNIEVSPRKGLVNDSFKNNHYAYKVVGL